LKGRVLPVFHTVSINRHRPHFSLIVTIMYRISNNCVYGENIATFREQ